MEITKPEAKSCSSLILWELLEEESKNILRLYLICKVSAWNYLLKKKNLKISFRETWSRKLNNL